MTPKKIILIIVLALVGLQALLWGYRYLTTATITITTKNASDILGVTRITDGQEGKGVYSKPGKYTLKVRQKSGIYKLSAGNRTAAVNKFIVVKARQHVSISLSSQAVRVSEPVIGEAANSVAADSSQLLFVDPGSLRLMRIDAANNLQVVDEVHHLTSVQWNGTAFGVGLSQDGKLYAIDKGAVSEIPLPFVAKGTENQSIVKKVGYALSPDGQIYVSNGADVYSGRAGFGFKKIYTARFGYLRLAASSNRLAIFYRGIENSEGVSNGNIKPEAIITDPTGKIIGKKPNANIYKVYWSPNGKYLLTEGTDGVNVYDESFRLVQSVSPSGNIAVGAWLTNNDLLYATHETIWQFDLSERQSFKLSNGGNGTIDELSVDAGSNYIYATSDSSTKDASQITRIGLDNQPVNKSLSILDIFLPEDIGVCSLNYINFSSPAITIRYPDSGTDPKNCIKTAQGELKYYGLDPTKFSYPTMPYKVQY